MVVFHDAFGILFLASGSNDCRLAGGGNDETIRLWDVRTRRTIATLRGHQDLVASLCIFKDSRGLDTLACAGSNTSIKVWDLTTHEIVFTLEGHRDAVMSLACFTNEDGVPMLVRGSFNHEIKVW
jgi:WD40 repeat protein